MTMTAPNLATVRTGATAFTATRMRRTCGVCNARTIRRTVSSRKTLMPGFSFVNCGRSPLSPLSSASTAGTETRLSRRFTNRRTSCWFTSGTSVSPAPASAPSAWRTPAAIVTRAPKRVGRSFQRRSPYVSRTGFANAGRSAAWACSLDIPPTGMPARVTPGWISTGGAASPRRAGARAATTRTVRARRRITWRDRTDARSAYQVPVRGRGEPPQRRPSKTESLGDTSPRTKTREEPKMDFQELERIAEQIVAEGKGILAADESNGTIKKRFDSIGVESTEETRRQYRELLFTTEGAEDFIGGVILFDETIRQKASDGTPFAKLLESKGIVPGIKVDKGAKPLALAEGETITEGLDGLRERLAEYRELGARFAKWRAVITIGKDIPSEYCLWTNAHALARFAALSEEAGLVPIVEPEVLMDGDHTIERSFEVTSRTLFAVFTELRDQRVAFEDMLLKPNMVLSGYDGSQQASDQQIAELTLKCFRRHVPAAVPGIV